MSRKKVVAPNFFNLPHPDSNEWKSLLVLIFGILFLLAGGVMTLRIPYLFYQRSRLADAWVVPAKILNVKMTSSGGGRHGSSTSVSGEYEFSLEGKTVRSDRLSIFSPTDDLYFRLRQAHEAGAEVPCYVDRRDPGFSAFERDIRILDLVGCLVLGVPMSMIGFLYLVRHVRALNNETRRAVRV